MVSASKASETTDKGHRRAREILTVARTILSREGNAGLSMRAVATEIGISLSTVQHYYPSRDALLEALLLDMLDAYQEGVNRIAAADVGKGRLAQFEHVIDYLLDDISDHENSAVMRELWALASRNQFAAEIVDKFLRRGRKVLRDLIQGLEPTRPAGECELRGALVLAQLQGLTLFLASPVALTPSLKDLKPAARQTIIQVATAATPTPTPLEDS